MQNYPAYKELKTAEASNFLDCGWELTIVKRLNIQCIVKLYFRISEKWLLYGAGFCVEMAVGGGFNLY